MNLNSAAYGFILVQIISHWRNFIRNIFWYDE